MLSSIKVKKNNKTISKPLDDILGPWFCGIQRTGIFFITSIGFCFMGFVLFCFLFHFFVFRDRVFLYSPSLSWNSVNQTSLERGGIKGFQHHSGVCVGQAFYH